MTKARIAAGAALLALLGVAAVAFGASSIRLIVGGQTHSVRAVQVAGSWYVNADDAARALGNGASFDAGKRTLYASASDRNSQMHTVDKTGGGFATDGTVAARLVSVKEATSFQGNAPDPGAHFVMATLQLKNLTNAPVSMYQVQTSMVAGSQHLNDGQFYDANANDLPDTDIAPGQTVTYLDVFELDDGVHADAILVHPPFAPTTAPVDILLKLTPSS
jgi:hypothetical protein